MAKHSLQEQGIHVDWATETLVTVGATEGIAAAFLGLLNPGDEVRAELFDKLRKFQTTCVILYLSSMQNLNRR